MMTVYVYTVGDVFIPLYKLYNGNDYRFVGHFIIAIDSPIIVFCKFTNVVLLYHSLIVISSGFSIASFYKLGATFIVPVS